MGFSPDLRPNLVRELHASRHGRQAGSTLRAAPGPPQRTSTSGTVGRSGCTSNLELQQRQRVGTRDSEGGRASGSGESEPASASYTRDKKCGRGVAAEFAAIAGRGGVSSKSGLELGGI